MNLLLELHGDLPDDFPTDERRLYIFGCARKACTRKSGSVRALRATRKVEVEQQKQQQQQEEVTQGNEAEKTNKEESAQAPKQDLGASLFGASSLTGKISANANPFSSQTNSNGDDSNNANPFAPPAASTVPAEKPEQTNTNNLSETFADKVRISAPEQPKSSNPSNISLKEPPEKSTTTTPWPPQ